MIARRNDLPVWALGKGGNLPKKLPSIKRRNENCTSGDACLVGVWGRWPGARERILSTPPPADSFPPFLSAQERGSPAAKPLLSCHSLLPLQRRGIICQHRSFHGSRRKKPPPIFIGSGFLLFTSSSCRHRPHLHRVQATSEPQHPRP